MVEPQLSEQRLRDIARLWRAERDAPAASEIAAVRANIEREVGPTIRRSVAARLLGVSQTALDRWISSGDVPVVVTPAGRSEVPRHAAIVLYDDVEQHRRAAPLARYPLADVLHQRRAQSAQLPALRLPRADRDAHGHRTAELRSLAYHRAVARQLDDTAIADARHRLAEWHGAGTIDPDWAARWEHVLSWSPERLARLIGADSEEARALRQSSPFAGTLSEPARRAALAQVR